MDVVIGKRGCILSGYDGDLQTSIGCCSLHGEGGDRRWRDNLVEVRWNMDTPDPCSSHRAHEDDNSDSYQEEKTGPEP
jgi:hypothetical protein